LRQNFPAAKITFLTTKENVPLLQGFRDVGAAIIIDRQRFRSRNPLRVAVEFSRLLWQLRTSKFSLAVDLQGNGESAWLTRMTGAKQRWGIVHKSGRGWAYTQSLQRDENRHASERQLALLANGGLKIEGAKNDFVLSPEASTAAHEFFAKHQLTTDKPTLFIQPLTSSLKKNWPLENYLSLAKHWQAKDWQVLFGGGPGDVATLEPARAAGFTVCAGVPLLVTGALMQFSRLIVGGDTGALHLAVAEGKRVVMLMKDDWPGRPHPFRHPEWSLLPPVNRKIATITLEQVIAACEAALG
jgi:ADP-heptose:LPS heptosyltransferase